MPHFHVSFDCNWAIKSLGASQIHAHTRTQTYTNIVMNQNAVCVLYTHTRWVRCESERFGKKLRWPGPRCTRQKATLLLHYGTPSRQSEFHPRKNRPRDRVPRAYYLTISMQKHSHHRRHLFIWLDRSFIYFVYRPRWKMFIARPNGVENERDKHLSVCARMRYINIEKRWRRVRERNLCLAVTLLSTINMFSYYNKQNK
jgi:hypothetical protein